MPMLPLRVAFFCSCFGYLTWKRMKWMDSVDSLHSQEFSKWKKLKRGRRRTGFPTRFFRSALLCSRMQLTSASNSPILQCKNEKVSIAQRENRFGAGVHNEKSVWGEVVVGKTLTFYYRCNKFNKPVNWYFPITYIIINENKNSLFSGRKFAIVLKYI